ncbi:SRPBCC family protein [Bosea robiniae]|uniref:Polyketide cyclase / dehydrase and lipid transport n=1 Tax=Bosea robiniae TaxID=1036780 RepID=A0ABY0P1G2_9HYPH|nr:SRPBCC family protein [Bosea robiniae]SDG59564.1 Polyketide cyclase / dehydrase and lipid transport [Bosea robiniae]
MTRAYYSTIFEAPAENVWNTIRSFGDYDWAGVPSVTVIENGRAGDQIGAVRRVEMADRTMRQILIAHSDRERSYSYEFLSGMPVNAENYIATLRVTPIIDGNKSFIEWFADFDATPDDRDLIRDAFVTNGFAVWLRSLRARLAQSEWDWG